MFPNVPLVQFVHVEELDELEYCPGEHRSHLVLAFKPENDPAKHELQYDSPSNFEKKPGVQR